MVRIRLNEPWTLSRNAAGWLIRNADHQIIASGPSSELKAAILFLNAPKLHRTLSTIIRSNDTCFDLQPFTDLLDTIDNSLLWREPEWQPASTSTT